MPDGRLEHYGFRMGWGDTPRIQATDLNEEDLQVFHQSHKMPIAVPPCPSNGTHFALARFLFADICSVGIIGISGPV